MTKKSDLWKSHEITLCTKGKRNLIFHHKMNSLVTNLLKLKIHLYRFTVEQKIKNFFQEFKLFSFSNYNKNNNQIKFTKCRYKK
jgi:hypothetical protein